MFKHEIKAQADGPAKVFIYGVIGDSWSLEPSPTALELATDLEGVGDVDVYINSKGGSVADAMAYYNTLARHDGKVRTYVDAEAYSAALPIFMSGEDRFMPANAMVMIHAPMAQPWQPLNAKEARTLADLLDQYAVAMTPTYEKAGGFTAERITEMLTDGEDHYFNAAEALELGIATDSIESVAALDAGFKAVAVEAAPTNENGGHIMPENKPEAAPVVDAAAVKTEVLAAVTARNAELAPTWDLHRSNPDVAALERRVLSDPTITADQARSALLDELGKASQPLNAVAPVAVSVEDQTDKRREGMTKALLGRMGAEAQDRANPYRGLSLSAMARTSLEQSGIDVTGQTPEEFAATALSPVLAAQTTSDFPAVLENTLHKMVLMGFNAAPTTWARVARIGDVTDFRAWKRLVPGLIGNLDSVDEHGNYKDKPLPDAEANSVTATRKGNIITITPEVLVNDDLGYIQNSANDFGAAGARTIDRAFYTLLVANPTLSDGEALFSAAHGNLASPAGLPTVTTIDAGAVAMSLQTAPGDDAEILDISPDIALSGRSLHGSLIETINAEYNDDATKNQRKPNRVKGIVSDIVSSGRIASTTAWYLFANPSQNPVIEVVFLNGQREPRVTQSTDFRSSGLAWKIELPFGVGAIDYRGGYHNAGA